MSPVHDAEGGWNLYRYKDDTWSKNRGAAIIHNKRRKTSKHGMCNICRHRNCGDKERIGGNKSFKKSKIINGPKRHVMYREDHMDIEDIEDPATQSLA